MDEVPSVRGYPSWLPVWKGSLWVENMTEQSPIMADRKTQSSISFKLQNTALIKAFYNLNDFKIHLFFFFFFFKSNFQAESTDVVVFTP